MWTPNYLIECLSRKRERPAISPQTTVFSDVKVIFLHTKPLAIVMAYILICIFLLQDNNNADCFHCDQRRQ